MGVMIGIVKGTEASKRSGPCSARVRRLVWGRCIALAFVGMLAASSLAVVLGVSEAQAQGMQGASRGGAQPEGHVANRTVTPEGNGSAAEPGARPNSGAAPAAGGQAARRQAPVSDSANSPDRGSPRDPHDEIESHGHDPTATRAPSRQSDATPPATEPASNPSGREERPAPSHEPTSTRHHEDSTQGAGSREPQGPQRTPAEKPPREERPSDESKPDKDEEPTRDEKPSKDENKSSHENRPSRNESNPPEDEKPSGDNGQPEGKENKPAKADRPSNESKPPKDDNKPANDHEPPRDESPSKNEENKPPEEENPSGDNGQPQIKPPKNKPPKEDKPFDEKPPRDEKPVPGPEAGEPTPVEKPADPEPDSSGPGHAERPAPSEEQVPDPAPDATSDAESEAPAHPKSVTLSSVPSTSSKPARNPQATEFDSDATTRVSTPEPGDGPVQPSVVSARKPESEAGTRVEPRSRPVVAERSPEHAPGTELVPTAESASDPAVTNLEQWATGTSRFIGEVFGASTGLVANSGEWIGDLASDLRGVADWLLGSGENGFNPPGDPLTPLGGHSPMGPAPPVPVPVGTFASGGLSFGQSSSFGHASKHLFQEFGTLVVPPVTLMQGGKAAWPRYEPLYPGSPEQYVLERPG